MTAGIANGEIKGWTAHKAAKRYPKYGVQKGWEHVTAAKVDADGFVELTDEEAQQMGFPFCRAALHRWLQVWLHPSSVKKLHHFKCFFLFVTM